MSAFHFRRFAAPATLNRLSAAVLMALAAPAFAQSVPAAPAAAASSPTPAPATTLGAVVVRGQAAATDRALDDQEAADDIRSIVRNDGIGRLPDKNAAESLARLAGVSIERDQGEGRYVRIRGLGADLNAVTINGSLVPSPESGRRAVMLDVLPSALIGSATVIKTLTPDMDANSIGGTVDIKTLSAFDEDGRVLSLELGGSFNDNVDKTSPSGSLVFANRFMDGKLGVAFGFNYEKRKLGSDNVETGGAWDGTALEEFERRDYRIERERTGGALNLEFKPTEGTMYFLRSMVTQFSDNEVRNAHSIEFDTPQEAGDLGDAEATRSLKARKETQRISSLVLGTDQSFGDWKMNLAGGLSRASEKTPFSIASADFAGTTTFNNVGFNDGRKPTLIGPAGINDAASYALDEIEFEEASSSDRERNLKIDLAKSMTLFGAPGEIKFGGKVSRRKKVNEQTTWTSDDFGTAPTGLGSYVGASPNYPLGPFGPGIDPGAVHAIVPGSVLDVDDLESGVNDYTMKEDINAAYLQSKFRLADWQFIAGLRYEGTRFQAQGTGFNETLGTTTATDVNRRENHWLPGLHLRRNFGEDTTLRSAWTNSVVRPTFEQLAPGFVIDGNEGEFGNPNLKPWRSSNLDVGIEHRLGYAGAVSAYAFHKNIRDFVYQTTVDLDPVFPGVTDADTFVNGDKAKVYGVELAYAQALRSLPAPWNGLLVSANATFTQSDAKIALGGDSRGIPLPGSSKRTYNLIVGWENAKFSARVAAGYKSPYLLEVGDVTDPSKDLYVDSQMQVDLALRYSPVKALQFSFEVQNLNDESYYVYTGGRSRNAQWETYGRTYRLSMKYNFE
jgi:TonB-dependent receptor